MEAKELFIRYGCSHFKMNRAGILDEYMKFQISKEQEEQWISEYITNSLTPSLTGADGAKEYSKICDSAANSKRVENIKKVFLFLVADNGVDDVTRLAMILRAGDLAGRMSRKGGERALAAKGIKDMVLNKINTISKKAADGRIIRDDSVPCITYVEDDIERYIQRCRKVWEGI